MFSNKKLSYSIVLFSFLFSTVIVPLLLKANRFTWDSWIYFRLSRILAQHYDIKAYAADIFSTDFPFGYPFVLSIAHNILGVNYLNSVLINSIISISCAFVIYRVVEARIVSIKYKIPLCLLIISSVLLNPFFLDELYSGRSIPVSLFLIITSYLLLLSKDCYVSIFIGSFLLGLTSNVRFDLLLGGIIILNLILFYEKKYYLDKNKLINVAIAYLAFLCGVFPWVVFSLYFHDSVFVSKNSIASFSSIQFSFTNYNDLFEMKNHTIFTNPLDWLAKVARNLPAFGKSFFIALVCQPFYVFLVLLILTSNKKSILYHLIPCFIMLFTLFPHLSAGFFDQRYFTFYFLMSSLFMITLCNHNFLTSHRYYNYLSLIFTCLFYVYFIIYLTYFWKYLYPSIGEDITAALRTHIENVASCHINEPEVTYIFLPVRNIYGAVYAGLTDYKVGFPIGYEIWSDVEKSLFFKSIEPYRIITNISSPYNCN